VLAADDAQRLASIGLGHLRCRQRYSDLSTVKAISGKRTSPREKVLLSQNSQLNGKRNTPQAFSACA